MRYFRLPSIGADGFPAIEDPPERIVEDGLIRCGLFKSPVPKMNLLESNALDRSATSKLSLPPLLEWVGVGMVHPDWFFGLIIVNAQIASLGVLYGYCRRNGDYFSEDLLGARTWVHVAESCWNDTTSLHTSGYNMEIDHNLEQGFHKVDIDISGSKGSRTKPPVCANLTWHENLAKVQPMVSMSPGQGNGFTYTHKSPMPTEGTMKIGEETITFDSRRDMTLFEEIKIAAGSDSMFKTKWNMFGGGGFDDRGTVIALATVAGPQKPKLEWSENCLWVGNTLTHIGPVDYEVDPEDIMKPWHVKDRDGRLDITVRPEGGKTIDMRPVLGVYHQKCGAFSGTLVDASGQRHEVKDFYGAGEYATVHS